MSDVLVLHFEKDREQAEKLVRAINKRMSSRAYMYDDAPERLSRRKAVIVLWSAAALASDEKRIVMEQRMFEALAHDELVLASLDRTRLPFGFNDFIPISLATWMETSSGEGFQDLLLSLEDISSRAAFSLDAATQAIVDWTEWFLLGLSGLAVLTTVAIAYDAGKEYGVLPSFGDELVELVDISAMPGYVKEAEQIATDYANGSNLYEILLQELSTAKTEEIACGVRPNLIEENNEKKLQCSIEGYDTEELERILRELTFKRDRLLDAQKNANSMANLDWDRQEIDRLERELASAQNDRAVQCQQRTEYTEETVEGTLRRVPSNEKVDVSDACQKAIKEEQRIATDLNRARRAIEILENVPDNSMDYAGELSSLNQEIIRIRSLINEIEGNCSKEDQADSIEIPANCEQLKFRLSQLERDIAERKAANDQLVLSAQGVYEKSSALSRQSCAQYRSLAGRPIVNSGLKDESEAMCRDTRSSLSQIESMYRSVGINLTFSVTILRPAIRTAGLSAAGRADGSAQASRIGFSYHPIWGGIQKATGIQNRFALFGIGLVLSLLTGLAIRFGIPAIGRRTGILRTLPPKKLVTSNVHYDAFISYAHRNKSKVKPLVRELKRVGLKVWVDEEGIMLGQDWSGSIVGAIKHSKHFILMGSNAAYASPNCYREINVAAIHNRELKPIIIEDAQIPDNFLYFLAAVQQLFVRGTSRRERLEKFRNAFGI